MCQFPKPTVKLVLTWKFQAFVPIYFKMVTLSIFQQILSKIHFTWSIFLNLQTPGIWLFNVFNMMKGNKTLAYSGYAKICFTINGPLKMLPCHFRYFHCSNFIMTFEKRLLKNCHFLTYYKFLICYKVLPSGSLWQLNDYRKCNLNNSQNLQKIFSQICVNCCNVIKNLFSLFLLFQHYCFL